MNLSGIDLEFKLQHNQLNKINLHFIVTSNVIHNGASASNKYVIILSKLICVHETLVGGDRPSIWYCLFFFMPTRLIRAI